MSLDEGTTPDYSLRPSVAGAVVYCVSLAVAAALISLGALAALIYASGPTGEEGHIVAAWIVLILPVQLFLSACSFFVYRDEFRFSGTVLRRTAVFGVNTLVIVLVGAGELLLLL